jgi:hypothetical protein
LGDAALAYFESSEWRLWAVLLGQVEIAWLDRGDTTNGSYEPKVPNAALCTNVRCPKYGQKRVVIKPRSAKGMRHTIYEGFFSETSSVNKDRL